MKVNNQTLKWLSEEDGSGISFLVGRKLLRKEQSKEIAYTTGHIGNILKHMHAEGYWLNPKGGYSPKYRSTVWSLILLSQLGASVKDDERIGKACKYYLDHALSKDGTISHNATPSGTFDCLAGNMGAALMEMDYVDERLNQAMEWMSKSQIGEVNKYYSMKCSPDFACGANGKQFCAWGAIKVMLALSKIPEKRSTAMQKAIQRGVDLLLGVEPITAKYPTTISDKPNGSWWKLGFPTFYCTDLLQLTEALVNLGYGKDKLLKTTIDWIISKQDNEGKWKLEHDYNGKTWGNFGEKGKSNKWVTYRVLKVFATI